MQIANCKLGTCRVDGWAARIGGYSTEFSRSKSCSRGKRGGRMRLNPNGIPSSSPGLAGGTTAYPGKRSQRRPSTPRGLCPAARTPGHNPVGVGTDARSQVPRVARSSQPFARGHNPVGIEGRCEGQRPGFASAEQSFPAAQPWFPLAAARFAAAGAEFATVHRPFGTKKRPNEISPRPNEISRRPCEILARPNQISPRPWHHCNCSWRGFPRPIRRSTRPRRSFKFRPLSRKPPPPRAKTGKNGPILPPSVMTRPRGRKNQEPNQKNQTDFKIQISNTKARPV
jgi:hypothetical protein